MEHPGFGPLGRVRMRCWNFCFGTQFHLSLTFLRRTRGLGNLVGRLGLFKLLVEKGRDGFFGGGMEGITWEIEGVESEVNTMDSKSDEPRAFTPEVEELD